MPSAIFMGRKPGSVCALQYLISRGWDIICVVAPHREPDWLPKPGLAEFAQSTGLKLCSHNQFLELVRTSREDDDDLSARVHNVEWVFSYLFPHLVKPAILALPSKGALNFHPAPLPEYGGLGGYNFAILEQQREYGVTCHFMDNNFDTGDIVEVLRFPIVTESETVASLERTSQRHLLALFAKIVGQVEQGSELKKLPQCGKTRYIDRQQFEAAKLVKETDSKEMIRRRIRAFWYPPYAGAQMKVAGEPFTLVSSDLLAALGRQLHEDDAHNLRRYSNKVTNHGP